MNSGERIRKYRKEAGLTQKELGERLGVSQQHIAQYENGKRIPKIETIDKIAVALNVSRNDLLDWKDIPEIADQIISSELVELKEIISEKRFGFSEDALAHFTFKINNYIADGNKIKNLDEREDYFSDAIAIISHELLNHILEPYLEYDIMNLVNLVSYYLSFSSNIRYLIDELLINLDDNSYVHQRDDE